MKITLILNNNTTIDILTKIYTEQQLIDVLSSTELVAITDIDSNTNIINMLNVFLIKIEKI